MGASIVKQCFYVDDLLTGADDLSGINNIKTEITVLLQEGGFPITKWKTNGPIVMRGKMMIQDLWRDKLDWDEEITGSMKEKWEKFNADLTNIKFISISRWLGTQGTSNLQLHGFCDASEKGYGAVLYARTKFNGKYRIELVASKSRVAPLKATTIPRLELCAASLLVNLIEVIQPMFETNEVEILCWTDSQIVLH
ncbi:uncharacterized protein LOC129572709, partial [Sitodiplosis mosellana]|uniref:uncharacterized protein LOC129572709 n=1 Tax=Sitodiplosis mosellana TaxID=263140 RepID=UPI0024446F6B